MDDPYIATLRGIKVGQAFGFLGQRTCRKTSFSKLPLRPCSLLLPVRVCELVCRGETCEEHGRVCPPRKQAPIPTDLHSPRQVRMSCRRADPQ